MLMMNALAKRRDSYRGKMDSRRNKIQNAAMQARQATKAGTINLYFGFGGLKIADQVVAETGKRKDMHTKWSAGINVQKNIIDLPYLQAMFLEQAPLSRYDEYSDNPQDFNLYRVTSVTVSDSKSKKTYYKCDNIRMDRFRIDGVKEEYLVAIRKDIRDINVSSSVGSKLGSLIV
jgi:hypothetical protein